MKGSKIPSWLNFLFTNTFKYCKNCGRHIIVCALKIKLYPAAQLMLSGFFASFPFLMYLIALSLVKKAILV